ncbi:MAG: hypothetical protein NXI24_12525 [bacterium]|nr:hypothetical protein [bacterium]
MSEKLSIPDIIQNGIQIGIKYVVPIIVNAILSVISIWIPYLNGGIVIAWMTFPVKMARGEPIEMTEVWKPEYRKNMGDVFIAFALLVAALLGSYIILGMGVVLMMGWYIAMQLVVDKGMTGPEAFKKSWEATYGNKMTIFLAQLVFFVGFIVVSAILSAIGSIHSIVGILTGLITLGLVLALYPILYGMHAYIYQKLG